mmetsp:Transcript_23742/g.51873  ORF Transcript_23742/g.51873 Transcript_23742/m.51873 type:complete len:542 (-) Transcript_23742:485-2110(-)
MTYHTEEATLKESCNEKGSLEIQQQHEQIPRLMQRAHAQVGQLSEASRGKKLLMFTMGSRGDVQPMVALACGLQRAGFFVRVLTNENHVDFMGGFGLHAVGAHSDAAKWLTEDKTMIRTLESGRMLEMTRKMGEFHKRDFHRVLQVSLQEARDFAPDALLCAGMEGTQGRAIGHVMNVPVVTIQLQSFLIPTRHDPSWFEEPTWLPGFVHLWVQRIVMQMMLSADKEAKHPELLKQLPECEPILVQNIHQSMFLVDSVVEPTLVGVSPLVLHPRPDWQNQPKLTGFWVVPKTEQEKHMKGGNKDFGGSSQAILEKFLASGPEPAYLGWGSMVCGPKERMAALAVRSLKLANLRGVVLGGWAGLTLELLRNEPDREELLKYAQENILFVPSAAHEWLFPQCCAIVHHGGAGTTAASLRSGRPTIITPCCFDQFSFARLVQDIGVGFGLAHLMSVTPEQLSKALLGAATNEEMIQKATKLGQQLNEEDGVGTAVQELDKFFQQQISTGLWETRSRERREKFESLAKIGPLARLGNFCSYLCCR